MTESAADPNPSPSPSPKPNPSRKPNPSPNPNPNPNPNPDLNLTLTLTLRRGQIHVSRRRRVQGRMEGRRAHTGGAATLDRCAAAPPPYSPNLVPHLPHHPNPTHPLPYLARPYQAHPTHLTQLNSQVATCPTIVRTGFADDGSEEMPERWPTQAPPHRPPPERS